MERNKIILSADTKLEDNEARRMLNQLDTRIATINDRTKRQTIHISELNERIKKLEKK